MRGRRIFYREVLLFLAMVGVESLNVGQNTIYKAAVTKGLNYHVFMVYSYAISALVLLPLACLFHRETRLPPLSIVMLGKFCILGFLGFAGQYLGYLGIAYSSPTLGSAMSNLSAPCTFLLAVLFRLEKLKLGSLSSQAKIVGTLVSILGALVVVLYNGPLLITGNHDKLTLSNASILSDAISDARSNWIVGGGLLACCYVTSSIWYIYQSKVVIEYPAEFILVFFYSLFAFFISLAVGIASEPNLSPWVIHADVRLWSIFIMVHTWGLHVKGPVYVALFRPLSIAIAAILGVIFLGDDLYLGSVIGSIVITAGFYTVLWGKAKDGNLVETSSKDTIAPLLKK
ncbi:nodulin MtN21 /EamA-like transporter family protein [Striga asiatica]|uniref:Nodulin MtN21 /EamA-like transporter family protein n=1 Tax=Striga asiatica TaxID=4170 RepID=A0A5A7P9F8_STRAF|nr:nodulin MtN21 /EamA-like transporter family protein [Striga asiatica]